MAMACSSVDGFRTSSGPRRALKETSARRPATSRRIDCGEDTDATEAHLRGRKEERKETPRHSVVEVVDQPRLADAREVAVAQRGPPEDIARPVVVVLAQARLERGMRLCVADGQR